MIDGIDEPDEDAGLGFDEAADAPQAPGVIADDFDQRLLGGALRIEVGDKGGRVGEIEVLIFAGELGGD